MNKPNLPKNWSFTTLGKVVEYGKTVKIEPEQIDPKVWVLELEDLEKDTSRLLCRKTFAERISKSSKNLFEKGDVLYGKLRPYLNKVLIADQPGCCTTEIIPIKVPETLNNRYLFYWLKGPCFLKYVAGQCHGLNMPRLGTAAAKAAPFILAPISTQSIIADQLDNLLARVESCRAHLDRAAAAIKRFRQSTLFLAISTPLFISENADEIWKTFYLKDVADIQLGKMLDKAKNRGKEVDYLRNVNVRWFSFDLADVKKMRLPESELANFSVKDGDVFICEGGEPGRAAVWRNGRNHFVYQKALHRVRLSDAILPEWLVFCLKVDAEKSGLEEYFTGTTIKHLTGVALKRYRFMAPSVKAQRLIVEKIEKLMKFADEVEEKINAGRERVESLTASILAKAFRGELV